MQLSQIKDITLGAVRIEENENGFNFYRFTTEQEELYKKRSNDFYMKSFATSGVKMRFCTNSQNLFLKVLVSPGSSRTYFSFDVFVNGQRIDLLNNFSNISLPADYVKISLPLGEFSKNFNLGIGEKEVCIYFPWSVKAIIKEITIDDHAFVKPVKPSKKMLCFGDSITQGYDALCPSNKYITKLSNLLDAQEFNKAIGGEILFPDLASTKEDFMPDYVTVAYGTNDWNFCTQEEFAQNCKNFLSNITANYTNAKVLVITPIWRKEHTEDRPFGEFENVDKIIKSVAQNFKNLTVVSGFNFVEHNEKYFADLRLHPNDKGFAQYFENLSKQISF